MVKLEPFYGRRLILDINFTTVPVGKGLKLFDCVTSTMAREASCVRRGTSAEPDGRVNRSFRLIAGIIKTWQSIILYSVSEPESPFDCTGFRLIQANTSQLNIYMRWYESCLFNLLLQSMCLAFLLLKRQNIDKEKAELIFLLGF